MKFLCLFRFDEDAFAGVSADEMRRLDDATIAHDGMLRKKGHLLIGSPLVELRHEVRIDRRRRKKVVDGPYSESKEVIGGVVLLEAASLEEAVALFDDDPIAAYARIDIRALPDTDRHSESGEGRPEFEG